jgi:hypothetical protein
MDLIGVLSNQDLQGRLRRAVEKLGDVSADSEVREPRTSRQRARRPGWVVTAIVEVLDCETPMRAKDIRAAVEVLVGESVAGSSVKQALASHASGRSKRFLRVSRGRYVLASPGRRLNGHPADARFTPGTAV